MKNIKLPDTLAEAGDSLEPHNPQGLTPGQVGAAEGFRLLQKDEVLEGKPGEFWSEKENKWVAADAARWMPNT